MLTLTTRKFRSISYISCLEKGTNVAQNYIPYKKEIFSSVPVDFKTTESKSNQSMPIDVESLLDCDIHQPGQYIGHELGAQNKNWSSSKVHWALTYPET